MQSCHVTGVLGPGSPCGSGVDHTDLSLPPSWESRAAAHPALTLWLIMLLGVKGSLGQRLPIVCWWGCVFIESEVTSVQNFPGSLEAWRCPSCPDGVLMEAVGASVFTLSLGSLAPKQKQHLVTVYRMQIPHGTWLQTVTTHTPVCKTQPSHLLAGTSRGHADPGQIPAVSETRSACA